MKIMKWNWLLVFLILGGSQLSWSQTDDATDSLGVIGDNLDLTAVLNTFKEAENIEAFEKALNDPEGKLNNLDLNEDNEVDYIRVIDETEDDAHAFILRVDLDEDESQDVAVIELEKTAENAAQIQIVGDEELYGSDYIIEPSSEKEISKRVFSPQLIVINVWAWPSVRFVYGPVYRPWRSPWRWRRYPAWWKPWRPVRWRTYHVHVHHHHHHYHRVRTRRCVRAHGVFYKHRRTTVRIKQHKHHHGHHGHKSSGTKSAGNKTMVKGNKNQAVKQPQKTEQKTAKTPATKTSTKQSSKSNNHSAGKKQTQTKSSNKTTAKQGQKKTASTGKKQGNRKQNQGSKKKSSQKGGRR